MTREEAITHIKDIIVDNYIIAPNMVGFDLEKQALCMAIKALKQPEIIRCEDCDFREDSWCAFSTRRLRSDGFCYRGKRKE